MAWGLDCSKAERVQSEGVWKEGFPNFNEHQNLLGTVSESDVWVPPTSDSQNVLGHLHFAKAQIADLSPLESLEA